MTTEQIIELVQRALRAEIFADDIPCLWPDQPDDPYLAEVREDLEFALEHLPVHRDDRDRPNLGLWRDSVEYEDLEFHLSRLLARQQTAP